MSRVVCSLGCVCLTLAMIALWGGDTSASATPGGDPEGAPRIVRVPGHDRIRVIRTAKKKTRKKGTATKDADGFGIEPAKEKPADPAAAAAPATGPAGGLKFSRDIAPIFVGNCVRCHNEKGMTKNGKLDLTTYEKIMKGATHEEVIVPGKPEESHLYLRLTGEETPKMPRQANQRPLSEAAIERVGQWIKEGAKLDEKIDPKADIASYASTPEQIYRNELAKMTPAQRDEIVKEKGLERWKKGNAKETPEVTPGKNFMLFGILPKNRVTATLNALESQYTQLKALTGAGGDTVEKIALYVFNDRTSFVEFVRSVENAEVEPSEQGRANLGTNPYVAVVDPLGGREDPTAGSTRRSSRSKKSSDDDSGGAERSLGGVLAEYLATGMVKRDSKAPMWLSLGVGAYYGARIDARSPATMRLRRDVRDQVEQGWVSKASDALGGETKIEDIRAVGFGIVETILGDPRSRPYAPEFVKGMLAGGEKLDDTVQKVFNMNREQFLAWTGEFAATHNGRSR